MAKVPCVVKPGDPTFSAASNVGKRPISSFTAKSHAGFVSLRLPEHLVLLIVEDRKDDVVLIKRALAEAAVPNPVHVVGDGEEAQAYLLGTGQYFDRSQFPLPDLILLDLKMPKLDGFEFLRWIRAQPALKTLRVVVLTSSEDVYDINRAYQLGANSFLVKPQEFINFTAMMSTLGSFWLKYSASPGLSREKAANPPTP